MHGWETSMYKKSNIIYISLMMWVYKLTLFSFLLFFVSLFLFHIINCTSIHAQ